MQQPNPGRRHERARRTLSTGTLAMLLGLTACALVPPGDPPAPDPGNPLQLNEAAVASAAQGDVETAWLLLERAARLAPHDTRIAANLAALRAFRAAPARGRIVGATLPDAAPQDPARTLRGRLDPPPPIWVAK